MEAATPTSEEGARPAARDSKTERSTSKGKIASRHKGSPPTDEEYLFNFEERFRAQRFRMWIGYEYPSEDEEWSVRCDGTPIQIATWIERILPASPDPELIGSGLDELEKQIPVGFYEQEAEPVAATRHPK